MDQQQKTNDEHGSFLLIIAAQKDGILKALLEGFCFYNPAKLLVQHQFSLVYDLVFFVDNGEEKGA